MTLLNRQGKHIIQLHDIPIVGNLIISSRKESFAIHEIRLGQEKNIYASTAVSFHLDYIEKDNQG